MQLLKTIIFTFTLIFAFVFLTQALSMAEQMDTVKLTFEIEAQSLKSALELYQKTSGLNMAYSDELVEGKSTNGVDGKNTPTQALKKILKGTGLTYTIAGQSTVVLQKAKRVFEPKKVKMVVAQKEKEEEITPKKEEAEEKEEVRKELEIEETVITATKTERSIQEVPATVYTVDSEQIELSPGYNIYDMLQTTPGIFVNRRAHRTMFFGRSKNMLVMVDGVPVNDLFQGEQYPSGDQYTDPDVVERVEVVMGPGSALYGAGAQGGVVNIITKRGKMEPHFSVSGRFGEGDHYGTSISGGAGTNEVSFNLWAKWEQRDHWLDEDHNEMDHSGFNDKTFGTKLDWYPTDRTGLSLTLSQANLEGEEIAPEVWGNSYYKSEPWRSTRVGLSLNHEFSSDSRIFAVFSHMDRTSSYMVYDLSEELRSKHDTDYEKVGGTFTNEDGESEEESTSGTSLFKEDQDIWGFYVQDEMEITPYTRLNIGARYDKHPNFDEEVSPRVGLSVLPFEWLTFYGSYGEAFVAPNFGLLALNPDLNAETSESWEVGTKIRYKDLARLSLVYHSSDYEDLIQWYCDATTGMWSVDNVGKAEIKGWEAQFAWTPNQHAELSFSIDLKDLKDKITGEVLSEMPEKIYTCSLFLKDLWGFDLSAIYQDVGKILSWDGSYFEWNRTDVRIAYNIDLSPSWGKKLQLYIVGDNITNEEDITSYVGMPQPGRMIHAGFKIDW
jgi:outer membrane receptor protein involved in Fe transport